MIWRRLFEKRKIERDLGEEIEHYITEATEQKIAGGLTREEARRRALIEFGGVEQVKEIMRQSRTGGLFETVLRDIRYALRVFLKNPSFSVLAVLTAGLGIAAAASSFSVVDGVLLRPLPYIEPDRLVQIWATLPMLRNQPAAAAVWDHFDPGYEGYQQFRQRQRSFDEVAVFSIESASMVQLADPRRINLGTAEASLFRLIGLPALHGRLIQEDDEKPGAPGIAVLGYDSWIKNFGGDPNVIGRRIVIERSRSGGVPRSEYTIAGVLPREFQVPKTDVDARVFADIWVPIGPHGIPGGQDLEIIGRLKPYVLISNAEREAATIFSQLTPDPSWPPELHIRFGARLIYWREQEIAPNRKPILLLFAAAGLLLLIACTNIANLLLDRAIGRRHELTLRFALGASRARILSQLVVESLILSVVGGMIGMLITAFLIRSARLIGTMSFPHVGVIAIDERVLFFAVLCSIITGLVFGLLPALAGTSVQPNPALKERATNRVSHRNRLQKLLIIAEISISFVLLVAAGLITRSLIRLTAVDPGLHAEHLLTLKLPLPPSRYGDQAHIESFYSRLLPRLNSLPGVRAVTARQGAPFTDYHSVGVSQDVVPEGAKPGEPPPAIEGREVLPNYFEVVGTRITEGRSFTDADVKDAHFNVSIVNKAMARAFWPTHSAVGQRLGGGIVVGVVDNPKEFKLGEDAQPVYYVPTGANRDDLTLFLRTAINPELLATAVSHEVHGIDPDLAIERMATMQSLIAGSNDSERQRTMLITIFAGVAVILVLIGLYGVISRSVTHRTRELGIRIAVGAPARSVLWLVLRESLTLTLAGSLIGAVAAVAATRLIRSFLFGITPTDVSTYAFIACGLIIASLAASYLPARRAVQIDPMECLRLE